MGILLGVNMMCTQLGIYALHVWVVPSKIPFIFFQNLNELLLLVTINIVIDVHNFSLFNLNRPAIMENSCGYVLVIDIFQRVLSGFIFKNLFQNLTFFQVVY